MITDLAHTAFFVRNMDDSLAFYALLGIHEAFRLHNPDGSLMLVYLHVGGDRFLELFPTSDTALTERGADAVGFFHMCLRSDDLRGDVEMLRDKGVQIDIEPQVGLDHNWQAWIRDPDGNRIELMELSEDSPQRQIARQSKN